MPRLGINRFPGVEGVQVVVLFLLLHGVLLYAWWAALRMFEFQRSERLLAACILYAGQIVAVSTILGAGGLLNLRWMIACHASIAAGLLWRGMRGMARDGAKSTPLPTYRFSVAAVTAVLLAVGFAATIWMIVGYGLHAAPQSYDGLAYHLPMAALMHQTESLDLAPVWRPLIDAYPKNIEIWFHWVLAFFGSDRLVDLVQLPFLSLGILSIYVTARSLGSSRSAACVGSLFFPFSPVVLTQVSTAYTDAAVSSLILSAVAIASLRDRVPLLLRSSLFGVCLGVLVGTKFSMLAICAVVFAAFALRLVCLRLPLRRVVGALILAFVLMCLLGGFTYVRNLRIYGNPVYPIQVAVGTTTIFDGPTGPDGVYGAREVAKYPLIARLQHSWGEVDYAIHTGLYGGFGWSWPFLAACIVASLAVSISQRDWRRIALAILFVLLFAVTPLNFRVRFVLFLLGWGSIHLAHLFDRLERRAFLSTLLALVVLGVSSFSLTQAIDARYREASTIAGKVRLSQPCGGPQLLLKHRMAYRWVRKHASADSVTLVPGRWTETSKFSPYCMWNEDFSNQLVHVPSVGKPEDLIAALKQHPGAFAVLPRGSARDMAEADGSGFTTMYSDYRAAVFRVE